MDLNEATALVAALRSLRLQYDYLAPEERRMLDATRSAAKLLRHPTFAKLLGEVPAELHICPCAIADVVRLYPLAKHEVRLGSITEPLTLSTPGTLRPEVRDTFEKMLVLSDAADDRRELGSALRTMLHRAGRVDWGLYGAMLLLKPAEPWLDLDSPCIIPQPCSEEQTIFCNIVALLAPQLHRVPFVYDDLFDFKVQRDVEEQLAASLQALRSVRDRYQALGRRDRRSLSQCRDTDTLVAHPIYQALLQSLPSEVRRRLGAGLPVLVEFMAAGAH